MGLEEIYTFLLQQYDDDHLTEGIMITNNKAFIPNFLVQICVFIIRYPLDI